MLWLALLPPAIIVIVAMCVRKQRRRRLHIHTAPPPWLNEEVPSPRRPARLTDRSRRGASGVLGRSSLQSQLSSSSSDPSRSRRAPPQLFMRSTDQWMAENYGQIPTFSDYRAVPSYAPPIPAPPAVLSLSSSTTTTTTTTTATTTSSTPPSTTVALHQLPPTTNAVGASDEQPPPPPLPSSSSSHTVAVGSRDVSFVRNQSDRSPPTAHELMIMHLKREYELVEQWLKSPALSVNEKRRFRRLMAARRDYQRRNGGDQ